MKNAAICQPLGHDERVGKVQAEVCKAGLETRLGRKRLKTTGGKSG